MAYQMLNARNGIGPPGQMTDVESADAATQRQTMADNLARSQLAAQVGMHTQDIGQAQAALASNQAVSGLYQDRASDALAMEKQREASQLQNTNVSNWPAIQQAMRDNASYMSKIPVQNYQATVLGRLFGDYSQPGGQPVGGMPAGFNVPPAGMPTGAMPQGAAPPSGGPPMPSGGPSMPAGGLPMPSGGLPMQGGGMPAGQPPMPPPAQGGAMPPGGGAPMPMPGSPQVPGAPPMSEDDAFKHSLMYAALGRDDPNKATYDMQSQAASQAYQQALEQGNTTGANQILAQMSNIRRGGGFTLPQQAGLSPAAMTSTLQLGAALDPQVTEMVSHVANRWMNVTSSDINTMLASAQVIRKTLDNAAIPAIGKQQILEGIRAKLIAGVQRSGLFRTAGNADGAVRQVLAALGADSLPDDNVTDTGYTPQGSEFG